MAAVVGGAFGEQLPWKKLPSPIAYTISLFASVTLAGLVMIGFSGLTNKMVPTHEFAVQTLNDCPLATEALGTPIEFLRSGAGTYSSEGAFGRSSWSFRVEGPKGEAAGSYAAENRGDGWEMRSLRISVDSETITLKKCRRAKANAEKAEKKAEKMAKKVDDSEPKKKRAP
jgi:hypothetical protein